MDLRRYAQLRASEMEKGAIAPLLAAGARLLPAIGRGFMGPFGRKAIQTGVGAAAKKAPSLINTAGNVMLAKDVGESVLRRRQKPIGAAE